jgi:hypothetical protein
MSKPRPIHVLAREIRSSPDEAEPSFSYEQDSFLAAKEDDAEDEFHRRLGGSSRRESSGSQGGSFWRTTTADNKNEGPSFSSMNMKPDPVRERKSSGLLDTALQSHEDDAEGSVAAPTGDFSQSVRVLFSILFFAGKQKEERERVET